MKVFPPKAGGKDPEALREGAGAPSGQERTSDMRRMSHQSQTPLLRRPRIRPQAPLRSPPLTFRMRPDSQATLSKPKLKTLQKAQSRMGKTATHTIGVRERADYWSRVAPRLAGRQEGAPRQGNCRQETLGNLGDRLGDRKS